MINALKQAEGRYIFPARRYNPLTVASRTSESLVRGSLSKTSILTASALAIGTNLYDFGKDAKSPEDFANKTLKKQEFLVSTAIDLGISIVVGAAAALLIGGLIVGAAAIGAATAPLCTHGGCYNRDRNYNWILS